MSSVTLFKNVRIDGGIRTGIEVDGELLLHDFEKGADADDPALEWFVDIAFDGPGVPTLATPEMARNWIADKSPIIAQALRNLAEKLSVGVDRSIVPFSTETPIPAENMVLAIRGSAMQKVRDVEIADKLLSFADGLQSEIRRLNIEVPVGA